jgi:hypothetical protein
MELASGYADPRTGRGIAVSHKTLARRLEVTTKVIQRCFWAADDVGLLERILDGSDMSMERRTQIRDHYDHHDRPALRPDGRYARRGTQSKLPNVYAATVPRWLATGLAGAQPKPARGSTFAGVSVDNSQRRIASKFANVHPPVGGSPTQDSHLALLSTGGRTRARNRPSTRYVEPGRSRDQRRQLLR